MPAKPMDAATTPAVLHIMLALAGADLHGYGIMQEVHRRTEGRVELGPGTLYRSIKHMLKSGLIVEIGDTREEGKRRVYRLTELGRRAAALEAGRLREIVDWAAAAHLIERGPSS